MAADPPLPDARRDRPAAGDDRPARRPRPRPGRAPGPHRGRLPGVLRDRRRRRVRPARRRRSTPRPAAAVRPSTAPTGGRRCTRRSCSRGRGQPAARRAPPGRAVDHRPGRRRRGRRRRRAPGAGPQPGPAGLRVGAGRSTRGTAPEPWRCCPRSAGCCRPAARDRGAIELGMPSQEVEPGPRRRLDGRLPRPLRSRAGTRRSRCSPGGARPGSCWTAGSGCCARCRRPSPAAVAALRRLAAGARRRLAGRRRPG